MLDEKKGIHIKCSLHCLLENRTDITHATSWAKQGKG